MIDPLAVFYVHETIVERKLGMTGKGAKFDGEMSILGKVSATSEVVTTADGSEVTTVASVVYPADTAQIPDGSRVTLPAQFGGRKGLVVTEGLHDAGLPLSFYRIRLAGGA